MTRGIWVNGLCRGLADGNGYPLWVGESPRGREDDQWRGGFGQRTLAQTHGRERMREKDEGGRLALNLSKQ